MNAVVKNEPSNPQSEYVQETERTPFNDVSPEIEEAISKVCEEMFPDWV